MICLSWNASSALSTQLQLFLGQALRLDLKICLHPENRLFGFTRSGRIAPSKISLGNRSLRHLEFLPSSSARSSAEGGQRWGAAAWREDQSKSIVGMMWQRYPRAGRAERPALLDEVTQMCGYHCQGIGLGRNGDQRPEQGDC